MSTPAEGPPADCNPPREKKGKQIKSKPIRRKDKRPILRGFRVGRMVYVHCPWCDRFHQHGWESEDDGGVITARGAHGKHGPDAPAFYWISVFRERDLTWIESDREWARAREACIKVREKRVKNSTRGRVRDESDKV